MKAGEIAAAINEHLRRFEADPKINAWDKGKVGGTRPYYRAHAYLGGRYIRISYISYQHTSSLTRQDAERYLEWLNAGNVGRHYEALRAITK